MNSGNLIKIHEGCFILDGELLPLYDLEYFNKYREYSKTKMGYKIDEFRRCYVDVLSPDGLVLDYGCGFGKNVKSNSRWFGYDINPYVREEIGSKFVEKDSISEFGSVCFFDSLEHLPDFLDVLKSVRNEGKVFVSIPCFEHLEGIHQIESWKHWRPGEHILYVSSVGFISLLGSLGFRLIDQNKIETAIGREDIFTFCFVKVSGYDKVK